MTRVEYLAACGTDRLAEHHRRYYAQFVTPEVRLLLTRFFPVHELLSSTDPHFNDLPLRRWDAAVCWLPKAVGDSMRAQGDYLTLGGGVCVLKEAARQAVEQAQAGVRP